MLRYLFGCLISLLICLTAMPSWAGITYVGGKVVATAGTTSEWNTTLGSLTGGSDATPSPGDLVVATYCDALNTNLTLSIKDAAGGTNYALIGSQQYSNDIYDTVMRVAYKVMSDPVDTNVYFSETVTGGTGSANFPGSAHIAVFRGVHATPLEQAAQQGTGLNTILVNPGSITPTTAGTYVYVVGCGATDVGGVFTQGDLSDFKTTSQVDAHDSVIGGGYLAWSSGAYSPATFGGGGTDNTSNSYAWTIAAFAPAAAGTVTPRGTLLGVYP